MGETEHVPKGPHQTNPLRGELERVLGEQMQIIQEQQAQATRIIRVGLTTAGLLLTLVSIAVSSGILEIPDLSETLTVLAELNIFTGVMITSKGAIVIAIWLFLMLAATFTFLRIFKPALAVLSPDAIDKSKLASMFSTFYFTHEDRSARDIIGEEHAEIFDQGVSLRTGVDSDKAEDLVNSENPEQEILEYHIGCVRGNEALIKANRRHLSEIYRSTATAAFLLIGMLMYSLMGSAVLVS